MTTEFACLLEYDDGRREVGQPSSLAFCKLAVQSQATDRAHWNPRAVAIMRREVVASEWQPLVAESSGLGTK